MNHATDVQLVYKSCTTGLLTVSTIKTRGTSGSSLSMALLDLEPRRTPAQDQDQLNRDRAPFPCASVRKWSIPYPDGVTFVDIWCILDTYVA